MRNVGRVVDSDSSLVNKKWAADTYQTIQVDSAYVNSRITAEITSNALQTKTYVDQHDALRAHRSDVDTADNSCVASALLNSSNGVAGLDSQGGLLTGQLPSGILTDRIATFHGTSAVYLTPQATHTVTTTNLREYNIADVTVTDPGYPWLPLPFAAVQGYSTGTPPASRDLGTGVIGRLVVMASSPDERIYAAGAATCAYNKLATYTVHPYGSSNDTPTTSPSLTGTKVFSLYASCHVGSGYLFSGYNLTFSVIAFPAV